MFHISGTTKKQAFTKIEQLKESILALEDDSKLVKHPISIAVLKKVIEDEKEQLEAYIEFVGDYTPPVTKKTTKPEQAVFLEITIKEQKKTRSFIDKDAALSFLFKSGYEYDKINNDFWRVNSSLGWISVARFVDGDGLPLNRT